MACLACTSTVYPHSEGGAIERVGEIESASPPTGVLERVGDVVGDVVGGGVGGVVGKGVGCAVTGPGVGGDVGGAVGPVCKGVGGAVTGAGVTVLRRDEFFPRRAFFQ
jgi:hypothetical protein